MKVTSAEAAKLLRQYNDEMETLLEKERRTKEFLAAMGEDVESVRPKYDYANTQKELDTLESKIRTLKHEINCFNITTVVPGFDMTVDMLLVYLPQLTRRKEKLSAMQGRLPKERDISCGRNTNIIDYRYTNYDVDKAAADYKTVSELLAKAQTALDVVNNTVTFEITV